eukprot:Partr_v1_DN26938_c0_g1_i2_m7184 putative phosphatidylinositol glycan anchor biosynthesis, class B
MSRQVLGIFLAVRLLNALTLRTFWSPDEYWQSLEVAHRLVYGYGYLTWEWTTRIRSATHPLVFAVLYKLLNILGLDRSYAVYINAPMIFQGALSATGEYYTWKLAGLTFGTGTQRWLVKQYSHTTKKCSNYVTLVSWFCLSFHGFIGTWQRAPLLTHSKRFSRRSRTTTGLKVWAAILSTFGNYRSLHLSEVCAAR